MTAMPKEFTRTKWRRKRPVRRKVGGDGVDILTFATMEQGERVFWWAVVAAGANIDRAPPLPWHGPFASEQEAVADQLREHGQLVESAMRDPKQSRMTLHIERGRLQRRDPNYGLQVNCYLCDTPHKASGLARLKHDAGTTHVPLCDACLAADNNNDIVRKFWNVPGLQVREGGMWDPAWDKPQ